MRTSKAGNRPRGFTLVELLVVLSIMVTATLAVAMAVPGLRPGSTIEAAASGLTSTLKKARMLAISKERTMVVNIDPDSRRYLIEGSGQSRFLPTSVDLQRFRGETGFRIRFYPDGSADNSLLALTDSGRRIALAVSPLTGRVTLHR